MLNAYPISSALFNVYGSNCALVVLISAEMRDVACGVAGLSTLEQRYSAAHPRFIVY